MEDVHKPEPGAVLVVDRGVGVVVLGGIVGTNAVTVMLCQYQSTSRRDIERTQCFGRRKLQANRTFRNCSEQEASEAQLTVRKRHFREIVRPSLERMVDTPSVCRSTDTVLDLERIAELEERRIINSRIPVPVLPRAERALQNLS